MRIKEMLKGFPIKQVGHKHLILVAVVLLFSTQAVNAALTIADPLDRIVAVVNDQVITSLELEKDVE